MTVEIVPSNAKATITFTPKKSASVDWRGGYDFVAEKSEGTVFGYKTSSSDGWIVEGVEIVYSSTRETYDISGEVIDSQTQEWSQTNGPSWEPTVYEYPPSNASNPTFDGDVSLFSKTAWYEDPPDTVWLSNKRIQAPIKAIVHCRYDPTYFTITTVSLPNNLAGSTRGGGRFILGTSVTITATPSSGYSFVRWESSLGRTSNQAEYSFVVMADEEWSAVFEKSARFNVRIHVPTSITPTFSSADLYAGSFYQHVKSATVTKQSDGLYIAPFDIDSDVTSAIVYIKFDYTGNGEVSIHAVTSQSERVNMFLLDRFGYINIQLSRAHIGDYVDVYFSFPPFLYVGRGIEGQDYIEVLENNSGEWYEIPWYRARDTAIAIAHPKEINRIAALKISVDQEEIDRQRRLRKIPVYKTSDGLVKLVDTTAHELNFYFSDTATYTENPPKIKNQSVFKPWNPWIVIDSIKEGLLFSTSNKQLLFANDKSLRCRTLEEI